jgi:hypothetical protein
MNGHPVTIGPNPARQWLSRRGIVRRSGAAALAAAGAVAAACAPAGSRESGAGTRPETAPQTVQFWPTWKGEFQVSGMTKMA